MTTPPPPWGAPPPPWGAPPPPSAPPPVWGAPPAPPQRRHHPHRWIWVLVAVMAVIVLLGASGGALWVQKFKPPVDAANAYLRDLAHGDYQSAFDRLCSEDRVDESPSSLQERVGREPLLATLTRFEVNPFEVHINGSRATVRVDLRPDESKSNDVVELRLRKEHGEWRPCGGVFGFKPKSGF